MPSLAENVASIRTRIAAAAARSGRDPAEVTLVAVSKGQPIERIREAYRCGLRDFGENYAQEALPKLQEMPPDCRWHFVGHLQSNKARLVAGRFSLVHSLDSPSLAQELGKRSIAAGIVQPVLIEVKLDPSPGRGGIEEEGCLRLADFVLSQGGLMLLGLMGIPPPFADPEHSRPYFRQLRNLQTQLPLENRQALSMGMSGDFEVAIEEGATLVRVGMAIFGKRAQANQPANQAPVPGGQGFGG